MEGLNTGIPVRKGRLIDRKARVWPIFASKKARLSVKVALERHRIIRPRPIHVS